MTAPEQREPTAPSGCYWCGIEKRGHFNRWTASPGWHQWTPPTQEQIKQRMVARREARHG